MGRTGAPSLIVWTQRRYFEQRHAKAHCSVDKETYQCIREKTGAQNIVKEIKKSARKSGYSTYRGRTQIEYQNKHYDIDQKDEGTLDDRRRDGVTNFVLRIKEQETRLTLQEHDDDDAAEFKRWDELEPPA